MDNDVLKFIKLTNVGGEVICLRLCAITIIEAASDTTTYFKMPGDAIEVDGTCAEWLSTLSAHIELLTPVIN